MASTITAADLKVKITEEIILNGKDQGATNELTIGSINEVSNRIITVPSAIVIFPIECSDIIPRS